MACRIVGGKQENPAQGGWTIHRGIYFRSAPAVWGFTLTVVAE